MVSEHASYWFKKMGITKKLLMVVKISGKYDILTVQDKYQAHKGNKTKKSHEIIPWGRELEEWRLKATNIQIKKQI